jgi:hypothetical protein
MANPIKETVEQIQAKGAEAAKAWMNADNQANQTKRDVLLGLAEKYAHDDNARLAAIVGYEAAWKEMLGKEAARQVSVRKSELNSVMEAVKAGAKNLKTLQSFKGGYHDFITKARELKPKTARTSPAAGGTSRTQKLTDKQAETIETLITEKETTPGQLQDIAVHAIEKLNKKAKPELAGFQSFILIQTVCQQLLDRPDVEEFFKEHARKVLEVSNSAIDAAQKAQKIAAQTPMAEKLAA